MVVVPGCVLPPGVQGSGSDRLVYLEQAALDHSDDHHNLVSRHVSSAHLESRGWDVNPAATHRSLHLRHQEKCEDEDERSRSSTHNMDMDTDSLLLMR